MRNVFTKFIFLAFAIAGVTAAFGTAQGGKISATLFDGQGNKEVLAEATHTPREPAPAPKAAPAVQQETTTATITDGKGRTVRTVEQKGDTSVVKDGKGRVVSSTTKNSDGSTTTRDGQGRVRETTKQQPSGK